MPHAETVDRCSGGPAFTSYGMFPPASTAMRAFNYSMIAAYEFACLSPDLARAQRRGDSTAGSEDLPGTLSDSAPVISRMLRR